MIEQHSKINFLGPVDTQVELARQHWVNACEFQPHDEAEIVEEMAKRVEQRLNAGNEKAVLLFDLDSTLYEVQPRTLKILQDWLSHSRSRTHKALRERVAPVTLENIGYSLRDTMTHLGLTSDLLSQSDFSAGLKDLTEFWKAAFFSNDYLHVDRPYAHAVDTVKQMHDLGATIVYLTGRDQPGMGEGTRQALRSDGFPFEQDRTHLLLKSSFTEDDLRHKKNAGQFLKELGVLVASFENEPRNLVALFRAFPQAMHVYFDSICSEAPTHPCRGLYKMDKFPRP